MAMHGVKKYIPPRPFCFFWTFFILLALSACTGSPLTEASSTPFPPISTNEVPSDTPEPTPTVTPPEPSQSPYRFGTPLAEGEPVKDDSFFDTAVFLGDSRTEGLQLFSGLKTGDFFWARGMSVFRANDENYRLFTIDGESLTLIGALGKKAYQSVYIMIGINELGYPPDSYESGLSDLIDAVISVQPDAVVYLQTLPPVNDAIARAHGLASYITNSQVDAFNDAIIRVAAEKNVVLLDVAEVYQGEDGQLPEALASDGCHFVYDGYRIWADYLRCHTMDPEWYAYSRGA